MKQLNNIRYFLFAISLLGLFANFAQNEYGLNILWCADLLIGCIFLTEAFVFLVRNFKYSKMHALYLFNEHFWIGIYFVGFFFKFMHWPGAGPAFALSTLILVIQYLSYLFRALIKERKKGGVLLVEVLFFVFVAIVAMTGVMFKTMHWPGSSLLLGVSGIGSVLLILLFIVRKKFRYGEERITFTQRLKKIPGKLVIVFCYFGFWGIYVQMVSLGILPGFYSLARPVTLEKLWADKNPEGDAYDENYYLFILHRDQAQE
jgi:hypothetical protein